MILSSCSLIISERDSLLNSPDILILDADTLILSSNAYVNLQPPVTDSLVFVSISLLADSALLANIRTDNAFVIYNKTVWNGLPEIKDNNQLFLRTTLDCVPCDMITIVLELEYNNAVYRIKEDSIIVYAVF